VSTSPFFYGRRIVYVNGVKLPSFVLLCTSRDQPRVRDRVHSVLPDKSSAMVTGRTKIFVRRPRSSRGAAPPRPFVRRLTLHLLDPSSTMAAQPSPGPPTGTSAPASCARCCGRLACTRSASWRSAPSSISPSWRPPTVSTSRSASVQVGHNKAPYIGSCVY
jgi:hypothetical protein